MAQSKAQTCALPLALGIVDIGDTEAIETANATTEIALYSITAGHKIQKRVATIIRHLTPEDFSATLEKPRVVVLRARSADASKMISVAEIAKREIAKHTESGGLWFQYMALGETTVERARENATIEETILVSEQDEQDGFEVMKTSFERAIEGRPKLRTIPILSLFLTRTSIDCLRRRFGEQTNIDPSG